MRIKKTLVIFGILVFATLSCNLPFISEAKRTPTPQETAAISATETPPQTNTPEITDTTQPAKTYEKVQIGFLSNLYLRYDPSIWEAYTDPAWAPNSQGQIVYTLHHKKYDCTLQANLGRGAPETWQRFVSEKRIGGLDYQVETWRETTTNTEVLVVYQYPAEEQSENLTRIEVIIHDHPQECIADTEAVLALSEEEIR